MRIRLLILLLIFIAWSIPTIGQTPDAIVEDVVGKALVKETKESKETGQLKDGDGLFAGQWVSCTTGCERLIVSYCNVPRPIGAKPKWRQIYAINCKSPDGQRGGGTGAVGVLRSPINSEVVRPATFSLRWDPSAVQAKLELSLRVVNGERIWGPYEVEGNQGSFTSDSLRAALQAAQGEGTLKLELYANHGSEQTERIEFDVISVKNEADLERKLGQFKFEPDEIVQAIGRASVFGQFDLIASEVSEFERALLIAKTSAVDRRTLNEVKKLTLVANWKAENTARVLDLCGSFTTPPSTSQPVCVAPQKEVNKPRILAMATASSTTAWTDRVTIATLEDALIQSGYFEVIEGSKRDRLLKEQGFNNSDLVDLQHATKVGKLLSARYIIVGNVLDVIVRKKGGGVSPVDFGSEINTRVQVQLIDVETGVVKASKSFEEKVNAAPSSNTQFDNDAIRDAYRRAMEAIALKFVAEFGWVIPTEMRILLVRGGRVALDISGDHVKVGQEFEVYSQDEPILGADGKIRGYVTTKYARLRIVETEPNLSWAIIIETYDENGAPDAAIRSQRVKTNMTVRRVK